jgi:hypothetical protein
MKSQHLTRAIISLIILTSLVGCEMPRLQNFPGFAGVNPVLPAASPNNGPAAPGPASGPEAVIHFEVQTPPGSSGNDTIYLTLLDEITGLAMNSQPIPMQVMETPEGGSDLPKFSVDLAFMVGSIIKYRYEREGDTVRVAEHLSDGSPVRYRLFHVTGPGGVSDVISRWTDSTYELPTGRIQGQATEADTGLPIPNLLITAGGAQTVSASDGSFMLEGLPPGTHNLVGYAMDGVYQTFQQGAQVAKGSTTPTPIKLNKSKLANVVFVVKVPAGTLPVVPLRLAGSFTQFGNTFASLAGGMSSLASNMPPLSTLPDGRYTITVSLPVGADFRYKYTLGDGFWNAEHSKDGSFRLRQLIVPDTTILVEDEIESWSAGVDQTITFNMSAPTNTPTSDFVSIQFNPLFGWTPPIPMWKLGENHWAYSLFGPLNLPGELNYRYCRNDQCGAADDIETSGSTNKGRVAKITNAPQTINDQVAEWKNWSPEDNSTLPVVEYVIGRGDGYRTGIELSRGYRPSWNQLIPISLQQIKALNANMVVFTPTWSFGRSSPGNQLPILALLPGSDSTWAEMMSWVAQAHNLGLNVAIRPDPKFWIASDEWWQSAPRNDSWWQVWFEQYRQFVLNNADLAQRSGAQTLILGGAWLNPALPDGKLPDGSPSNVKTDVNKFWMDLLAEIRSHFNGQIAWMISSRDIPTPPTFLSSVDRIYLELRIEPGKTIEQTLGGGLDAWLDSTGENFQSAMGKPLLVSVSCPSNPDLQAQVDCYQTLLKAANKRNWISGFVSAGYYPPVALKDQSYSINGKPAGELLALWFKQMVK